MKTLKIITSILVLSLCIVESKSQNEITVRQELSLNPAVVLGGTQHQTAATQYKEQGLGYHINAGYTILFKWIGVKLNYYYQRCDAQEEEILARTNYTTLTTGDYSSNGLLFGIEGDIPLTKQNLITYINLGFSGGPFIAHLPEQEFTLDPDGFIKYIDMRSAGFARELNLGVKADFGERFAAGLNFNSLFEYATFQRESFGTIEDDQYYKWNFSYNLIKFGLIYRI